MKVYPEELLGSRLYAEKHPNYPALTESQLAVVSALAANYYQSVSRHRLLHNSLGLSLIALLLALDLWVLASCESAVAVIFIHGFLMYSGTVYSMHEGAGHNRIVIGSSPLSRAGSFIANHFCRIFFADPVYYKSKHLLHHSKFGTAEDGAFTNFVLPKRFWKSMLPLAGVLGFNDYKIHAGPTYTKSRICTEVVGLLYLLLGVALLTPRFGLGLSFFILAIAAAWVAFTLDRLRESTEHQLMPTDRTNGTRNLGFGFWGLLIGGGPWGQPCHLSHHLAPQLPWYQQLRLAHELEKIMTPEQRSFFLVRGPLGFPSLLKRVIRETSSVKT